MDRGGSSSAVVDPAVEDECVNACTHVCVWLAQSILEENKDLREQLDTALAALKKARDREASAAGAMSGQVHITPSTVRGHVHKYQVTSVVVCC